MEVKVESKSPKDIISLCMSNGDVYTQRVVYE